MNLTTRNNKMYIPCDDCQISDICGLVGSRKFAANRVDAIKKEVTDEHLRLEVVCLRKIPVETTAEDTAVTSGESTDRDVQGLLPVPGNDGN